MEIRQAKVLLRHKGKYLLLKKVHSIHADHVGGWETPGGKIEPKEQPKEAALREVKEETGLSCTILAELPSLKLEKDGIATHTSVFLAEAKSENVAVSREHSDFIWVRRNEIDPLERVIYKDLLLKYVELAEHHKNHSDGL